MKQLCGMTFEDDNGPAGEKLIVVQIGVGKAKVSNEVVFFGPVALAGVTCRISHG
jgi:hypothetical protein